MSDTYKMEGTVLKVMDTQTFDSGFTKREFVVSTGGDYNQDVKFEVIKDKCATLDDIKEGAYVEVSFNVKGREHDGKFYTNLQAWRVLASTGDAGVSADADPLANNDDDMPF